MQQNDGITPFCTVSSSIPYSSGVDDLDRALLAALRVDGRTPVAELARRLEVSRATVTARIDRLLDSGVIAGFSVRVRSEDDPLQIRAVCMLEVQGRTTDAVIEELRGMPGVVGLHSTNGAWDLIAELRVTSLGEFDRLLVQVRSVTGVLNSETSLLLSSVMDG